MKTKRIAVICRAVLALAAVAALSGPARAQDASERLIGERLIVGFHGVAPSDPGVAGVALALATGRLGGIILFRDNIVSPGQVRALIGYLKSAAGPRGIFVMVDQEGGSVVRFTQRSGFAALASARDIAAAGPAAAAAAYARTARELASVGVNVNLGPVVDLDLNPANPIIGARGRSYGASPAAVAPFARAFIDAHRSAGILTAIKHFPGHGSANADTHRRLVDISQSWKPAELEPFRQLAGGNGAEMVLVGHLVIEQLGSGREAASLSPAAVRGFLRARMGFAGLVVTDDLDMGAILRRYGRAAAAVRAIRAGNDLLIYANRERGDPKLPQRVIAAVKTAVARGELRAGMLQEAHPRIAAALARVRAEIVRYSDAGRRQGQAAETVKLRAQ